MPPKTHNKLVRNRIPEIIAANNQTCTTEILSNEAYLRAKKAETRGGFEKKILLKDVTEN